MNSLSILFAAAALGVDYGWQYDKDGKLEYLIQLEPALIRSMENGLPITSELEPQVRGVRRFRITIGTGPLPRDPIRTPPAEQPASAQAPLPPSDRSAALDKPRLAGDSPPLASDNTGQGADARDARPEPDQVNPRGDPIEQAAAKPADSPSDAASADAAKNQTRNDGRPADGEATGGATRSPWFVGAIVALCASLGVNVYQGWNLKSARRRYYQLVDRLGLRPTAGSDGVSIVP